MNKHVLSLFFFAAIVCLGLMSNSAGRGMVAGAQLTGAPGENATTCAQCHSGGNFGTSVDLSLSDMDGNVLNSYVPGEMYFVNLNINASSGTPSRFGFQMVSLDAADQAVNSWGDDIDTQLRKIDLGGRDYIEQTMSLTSSAWSIPWVGPEGDVGDVIFYACGNNCDGTGGTTGDLSATTTLTVSQGVSSSTEEEIAQQFNVFPNPVSQELNLPAASSGSAINLISVADGVQTGLLITNGQVDLSQFSNGVYVVQYYDNSRKSMISEKIIKL